MNQQQIADVLGISTRQVRNLTQRGVLTRSDDGDYGVKINILRYHDFKENPEIYRYGEVETDLSEVDLSEVDLEAVISYAREVHAMLDRTMKLEDFKVHQSISAALAKEFVACANSVNAGLVNAMAPILQMLPAEQWREAIDIFRKYAFEEDLIRDELAAGL